jgi:hypothetical protein
MAQPSRPNRPLTGTDHRTGQRGLSHVAVSACRPRHDVAGGSAYGDAQHGILEIITDATLVRGTTIGRRVRRPRERAGAHWTAGTWQRQRLLPHDHRNGYSERGAERQR